MELNQLTVSGLYRGRLAPSPTGLLHLGHARTFWIAQERERSHGGSDRGTQTGTPRWSTHDGARERGGGPHHCAKNAVPPLTCHAAEELMAVRNKHSQMRLPYIIKSGNSAWEALTHPPNLSLSRVRIRRSM